MHSINTFHLLFRKKNVSDSDCNSFIFKNFQNIYASNQLKLQNFNFSFSNVNADEVLDLLNDIDIRSSPGISGIPCIILKKASITLSSHLTKLFNMCINQSIFINEWKTAIITPLYKNKGNIEDLNNYRGISVLPPLAKIFIIIFIKYYQKE